MTEPSQTVVAIAALLVGALLGALVAWLALRGQHPALTARLAERERELAALRGDVAQARIDANKANEERARISGVVEAERASMDRARAELDALQEKMKEAFAVVSQQALKQNNDAFLDLAQTRLGDFQRVSQADLDTRQKAIDQMVKPVNDGIAAVHERLQQLDKERVASAATLLEHLRQMALGQEQLTQETQTLVRALRAPQVRGQWGELQLQRVVELAGMVEHCDFVQQHSVQTDDGRLRPDLIVRIPGHKIVVVDAKAPLSAYLDAIDATDDVQRGVLLDQHARQVRDHIVSLSDKDYANEFTEAPDFVVMFLPGESFFSAACQRDPNLIDFAVGHGIIPASPTTLITILKAVHYGWQQERIARGAEEIRDLGQTLYDRIRVAAEHLGKIRKGLEQAVAGYNSAVGAFESRVLPTARRFRDLGAGAGDEIAVLDVVEVAPPGTMAADNLSTASIIFPESEVSKSAAAPRLRFEDCCRSPSMDGMPATMISPPR